MRRYLVITGLCLGLLALPGCWDYHRINDRSQIMGIGVDPAGDGKYRFTLRAASLQSAMPSGGGQQPVHSEKSDIRNFSEVARTLREAIAKKQTEFDKWFYLDNLQAVVLSTHLTGADWRFLILQMLRDPGVDKTAVLTCSELSTQHVLEADKEYPASQALDQQMSPAVPQRGYATRVHLWEFWRTEQMIGEDAHVPLVNLHGKHVHLAGTEVFHEYAPVGYLSAYDTVFYNLAASRLADMSLRIERPDHSGFGLRYTNSRCRLRVTMNHGRPVLRDDISVRADLVIDKRHVDEPVSNADVRLYEQQTAAYLTREAERVLRKLQQDDADVYGFGRRYAISNPAQVAFVRQHWPRAFRNAAPDVRVHVHIIPQGTLL